MRGKIRLLAGLTAGLLMGQTCLCALWPARMTSVMAVHAQEASTTARTALPEEAASEDTLSGTSSADSDGGKHSGTVSVEAPTQAEDSGTTAAGSEKTETGTDGTTAAESGKTGTAAAGTTAAEAGISSSGSGKSGTYAKLSGKKDQVENSGEGSAEEYIDGIRVNHFTSYPKETNKAQGNTGIEEDGGTDPDGEETSDEAGGLLAGAAAAGRLSAAFAAAARRAPAVGGAAMLESGPDFAGDIARLTAPSAIHSVVFTSSVPPSGANVIDVGERHVHDSSCYHVHVKSCWKGAHCVSDGKVTRIDEFDNNVEGYTDRPIGWWYYTHCKYCGDELICKNSGFGRAYGDGEEDPGSWCHSDDNPGHKLACGKDETTAVCGKGENTHETHINAWFSGGTLYLYNRSYPGQDIFFAPDSSRMFADMSALESLDLTHFRGERLEDTTGMFPASLEAITLNGSFRFSDSQGTYATEGSGLTDAWEMDGMELGDGDTPAPFRTQRSYNTTLLSGTFEGRWNSHAAAWQGTWVRNDETHRYFARGQAATTPGGNAWEEHNPDKKIYGYCFAQHLAAPDGFYNKILVDDPAILHEILNGQQYQSAPAADNIRDAIITVLYYGFPNGQKLSSDKNIQAKYGLSDSEYSLVTWNVICHYSDGFNRRGSFSGNMQKAYDDLFSCRFSDIPDDLRSRIHLYIYVSEQHQQHMVAIDGVTYQNFGGVCVRKVDDSTGAPLQGAEFTIYDARGNAVDADRSTKAIDPIVSGSDGRAYLCRCDEISGLPPGTYTIRETKAPKGYALSNVSYTFEVRRGGCITRAGENSLTGQRESMIFRDSPEVIRSAGGIRIRKVDGNNTSRGLLGGRFGVFAAQNITASSADGSRSVVLYTAGEMAAELIPGLDGYAQTAENALPLGSYYLMELEAPAGYIRSSQKIPVTVSSAGGYQDGLITIPDTPKSVSAKLKFHKEVLPAGHTLPENQFIFDLYRVEFSADAGGRETGRTLVGSAGNDKNGDVVFTSENTGGALTFRVGEHLGTVNFVCVERTDTGISGQPGTVGERYACDTHEEFVELSLIDDGSSDHLIAKPMYGAQYSSLKTVALYADDDLIRENYEQTVFKNEYRDPPEIPDPVKTVSLGADVTPKFHNTVKYGEIYQYDVIQKIPEERPVDYFRSFSLHDEFPEEVVLKDWHVLADGTDVTDCFRIDGWQAESAGASDEAGEESDGTDTSEETGVSSPEDTSDSIPGKSSDNAEERAHGIEITYTGNLQDPSAYGRTYDFCFTVQALREVTTMESLYNAARVDIVYQNPENHCLTGEGRTGKNAVYETETPYLRGSAETMEADSVSKDARQNPESGSGAGAVGGSEQGSPQEAKSEEATQPVTKSPEKAVHSRMTNTVRTDLWPCIPDFAWTLNKKVFDSDGRECNTLAMHGGDELIYTITASNLLKKTDGWITVTDPLPEHVTFLDADNGGALDEAGENVIWNDLDFDAGRRIVLSFRVRIDSEGAYREIDNQAEAVAEPDCAHGSGQEKMPDLRTNRKSEITHNYVPEIRKAVTDGKGRNVNGVLFEEGTELTYHLYVYNPDTPGKDPERNGTHIITIRDEIPENTELVSAAEAGRVITELPDIGALTLDDSYESSLTAGLSDVSENMKAVSWTEEFTAGETREYIFRVRMKGKESRISNVGVMTVQENVTDAVGDKTENGGESEENSSIVETEFHSNEVSNGTVGDPLKRVLSVDGRDVNESLLEVGGTYRYTVTVINSGPAERSFTVTDQVTELVDLVEIGIDGFMVPVQQTEGKEKKFTGGNTVIINSPPGTVNLSEHKEIGTAAGTVRAAGAAEAAGEVRAAGAVEAAGEVRAAGADEAASTAKAAGADSSAAGNAPRQITAVLHIPAGKSTELSFTFRPNRKESHFTNQALVELTENVPVIPGTEKPIEGGEDHPVKKDTNEVENWTPKDPEKSVSRKLASTGENQNMDGIVVFGANKDTLNYAIRIFNNTTLRKAFTITDPIDNDLAFLRASDGGAVDEAKKAVVWKLNLEPGETRILSFDAKVICGNREAHAENLAVMSVDEANPPSNRTDTPIDTTPTKTVQDRDGKDIDSFLVSRGDELIYTIQVHNPALVTKQFRITDRIPDNTTYLSAETGKSVSGRHGMDKTLLNTLVRTENGRRLTWTADIPAGEDYRFVFRVKASKSGCYIPNEAEVCVDRSTIRTNLVENWTPEAPLKAVTADGVSADGKTFVIGEETLLTYQILVKNPAGSDKTFTVTDVLDSNLNFISADNNGKLQGRTVTWQVEVGAGEEKVVSFQAKIAKAPTMKSIPNKAEVSCDQFRAETNIVTVYLRRAPETSVVKTPVSEEITSPLVEKSAPATGDTMSALALGILAAVLAAGCAGGIYWLTKRRRQ